MFSFTIKVVNHRKFQMQFCMNVDKLRGAAQGFEPTILCRRNHTVKLQTATRGFSAKLLDIS